MINARSDRGFLRAAVCLLCFGMVVPGLYGQVGPPPVIVLQPQDQTLVNGATATLIVVAISPTQLSYKWYKNGKNIGGAKDSFYVIDSVRPADAGTYCVHVRNAAGTVTSSNAVLTIVSPPLACANPQMTTNGFSFALSGPAGASYIILTSTNLADWTPISTNAAPTGSVVFTDADATNHSLQYYRAELR